MKVNNNNTNCLTTTTITPPATPIINNEPPRFGLESRPDRSKNVNTRKQKELIKIQKMVLNEKQKKADEKKKKNQPIPKSLQSTVQPVAGVPRVSTRPPLVFGKDTDKNSIYPTPQDYDQEDAIPEPGIRVSLDVNSVTGGRVQTENLYFTQNERENIDLQIAIEKSFKEMVILHNPQDEIENDFVVCDDEDQEDEESGDDSSDDSDDGFMKTDGLMERWELLDEQSTSTAIAHLLNTPYSHSEVDFPFLRIKGCKLSNSTSRKINPDNPWLNTKNLIAAITQQS
eukprot:gene6771-8396_t